MSTAPKSLDSFNPVGQVSSTRQECVENKSVAQNELRRKLTTATSAPPKCRMQLMDLKPVDEAEEPNAEQKDKKSSKEDRPDERVVANCGQQIDSGRGENMSPAGQEQQQCPAQQSEFRESTPPSQLQQHSRRFRPLPNLGRRLRRQAARLRHSIALTNRRHERNRLRQRTISRTELDATNITSTASTPQQASIAIGNSAVRVLFRDHLQQQQQQVIGALGSSIARSYSAAAISSNSAISDSIRVQVATHPINEYQHAAVVEASRRLIERQIEAIREADSRRWNFDFRNCRPMNQPGHRYYGHAPRQAYAPLARLNRLNDDNNNEIISRDDANGEENSEAITSSENNNNNQDDRHQLRNVSPATSPSQVRNSKPLNDQNQNRDS